MPVTPEASAQVVPVTQALNVEGDVRGQVIALQFTGVSLNYLVVSTQRDQPPVWLGEHEITGSYIK